MGQLGNQHSRACSALPGLSADGHDRCSPLMLCAMHAAMPCECRLPQLRKIAPEFYK